MLHRVFLMRVDTVMFNFVFLVKRTIILLNNKFVTRASVTTTFPLENKNQSSIFQQLVRKKKKKKKRSRETDSTSWAFSVK